MTKTKDTPDRETREQPSKIRYADPTSEDLALAARSLYDALASVVASFDRMNAIGKSDAEAWERLRFLQPASKRVNGSKMSGPEIAIREYAVRNVQEGQRKALGRHIGELALALARGERKPDDVLRAARALRGDKFLEADDLAKLRDALATGRNEGTRWRAAYNILAFDAPAWPPPDTARGRGALQVLYETLSGNPTVAEDTSEYSRTPKGAWIPKPGFATSEKPPRTATENPRPSRRK